MKESKVVAMYKQRGFPALRTFQRHLENNYHVELTVAQLKRILLERGVDSAVTNLRRRLKVPRRVYEAVGCDAGWCVNVSAERQCNNRDISGALTFSFCRRVWLELDFLAVLLRQIY